MPSAERITVIDCLRGAALFGILAANMRGFAAPATAYFRPDLMWPALHDRIAQSLVDWLISGKFITIFSALFGIGFGILMQRAAARGRGSGVYMRRMTALLLIGGAHAFLLWWGDILISYAVCGFFLIFFRNRSSRTILWWAHGLYWFMLLVFVGFYVAVLAGAAPPAFPEATPDDLRKAVDTYANGTFGQILRLRAQEWLMLNSFVVLLTRILGIFLYGLYIWRQGYVQDVNAHLDWWRRVQRISFPIGLAGNAITAVAVHWTGVNPFQPSLPMLTLLLIQSATVPALSLFYASTIVLLYQDPVWRRRLHPFSYVGRMALTNYLLQSVICTTIFYSYGLGLAGTVGPLAALPLAVVVYGAQVPLSRWWLSRWPYGPVEWVWRRVTYGAFQASGLGTDAQARVPPGS
ncbi:MAG TPA: DUF418 domain-containing protein [Vicinamibacterales bacterium]|nr:DUF418 domain-containing protein [Vicinamibacterales bacterium]